MDRRATPENGHVAASRPDGPVKAGRFAEGYRRRVTVPVADLAETPEGPRLRQIQMGEAVTVHESLGGWAFVRADKDGYVGYVKERTLAERPDPTHWLAVPASHCYSAPDIKSPDVSWLGFGSLLTIVARQPGFMETDLGRFVPERHLWPVGKRFSDPVNAAQLHFGAPYLWGGNSTRGIDCSGLVQASLVAAGLGCPGDSDMQEAELGYGLPPDTRPERGDLLFWKGHVAIAVDGETLLHANAHHMAVAYEPYTGAVRRIEAQGGGPVTSHRRLRPDRISTVPYTGDPQVT